MQILTGPDVAYNAEAKRAVHQANATHQFQFLNQSPCTVHCIDNSVVVVVVVVVVVQNYEAIPHRRERTTITLLILYAAAAATSKCPAETCTMHWYIRLCLSVNVQVTCTQINSCLLLLLLLLIHNHQVKYFSICHECAFPASCHSNMAWCAALVYRSTPLSLLTRSRRSHNQVRMYL